MSVNIENPPYVPARDQIKGRARPVQLIVIHSMEAPETNTTAEAVARYFQNPPRVGSAHYCVDNDSVVQCVYDANVAYACKNANQNGVHIELAGYARQTEAEWLDQFGIAQLEIAARLGAYLSKKFNVAPIPAVFKGQNDPAVTISGYCGHADVPLHGFHTDPGAGFPWSYYLDRVRTFQAVGWRN
jgi:N-acetyl-anhydromuramyl-L-alanine amidase AmpD